MRIRHWSHAGLLIAVSIATASISVSTQHAGRVAEEDAWAVPDPRRREIMRVQAHLDGAVRMLRRARTEHLSGEQRAARERNVALLREYREQASFPRNVDFPLGRRPSFVDDRGVHCAMAHLIACSGRRDIVERIRATRNHARIKELATDAGLVQWLEDSGLTLAEAARIQPAYGYDLDEPDPSRISAQYAVSSAAASLANGVAITWILATNRQASPSPWRGVVGAGAGLYSAGLGAAKLGERGDVRRLAIWNTALGALSLGVGAHALFRHGGAPEQRSLLERPNAARPPDVRWAARVGPTPGVQLTIAF